MPLSRKAFALEFVKGVVRQRILKPDNVKKLNPDEHFGAHEESPYLSRMLKGVPYATFTTDIMDKMNELVSNGYRDKDGVLWKTFFGYWKDQKGRGWMCPEIAGIKDLRDVGIHTFMKDPNDFLKVAKYVKREIASLAESRPFIDPETAKAQYMPSAVWGKEIAWNELEQTALVLIEAEPGDDRSEEDRTLAIRYVDLDTLSPEAKALVDGMIPLSEKACRVLKLSKEPLIGMVWRGTIGTERGLGKGHMPYKADLSVDIVIYGPKKILRNDQFFFGNMGMLHAGVPHTDRQAYVNFGFHRKGLAVTMAKKFIEELVAASKNEAALRALLLRHLNLVTDDDDETTEVREDQWVLLRAMKYGFSPLRFPGLYRRIVRYLTTKVMRCETSARIPMESTTYCVAKYAYVMGDLNAIDESGNVDMSKAIPEGCIVMPDVKPGTNVVCYRQPSENSNAWVALRVIRRPEYDRMKGRGICVLGKGAEKVLGRLGGGDMDDSFVIVVDPVWVEAFHTLRPYPETEKITPETVEMEQDTVEEPEELRSLADKLYDELQSGDTTTYSIRHVEWQIEVAKNARAGIGPVVNYGMMDMLMSDPDHKASMLKDLQNDPEAYDWLSEREPYQAAKFMTNLELIIDGNVKDRALLNALGDVNGAIKSFHKTAKVYPASMAGGFGFTSKIRVPKSRKDKKDYVTARSLTCRSLEEIMHMQRLMTEYFTQVEYLIATPYSTTIDVTYPRETELIRLVGGHFRLATKAEMEAGARRYIRADNDPPSVKDVWGQSWVKSLSDPVVDIDRAYTEAVAAVRAHLVGYDEQTMRRIAVEVYRVSYRGKRFPSRDERTGQIRRYPDGLLWSPAFANYFIDAVNEATNWNGDSYVTGYYVPVDIRPELRAKLLDISEMIEIRDGSVYILDEEDKFTQFVGLIDLPRVKRRICRMDNGIAEIRRPDPMLLPMADDLKEFAQIAQQPLVRLYPPKAKEVKPVEAPRARGKFGELLDAAKKALGLDKKEEDKK